MDEEYKNMWVDELMGIRYPKGKYRLQKGDRYCPLGVLCDIHPDVVKERKEDGIYFTYQGESKKTTLPEPFRQEMGISKKFVHRIEMMNDNGRPTRYIASWIEENL